ncbi:protein of unknown function [Methylorubrum extorquens]|uniref:Uncharacterized protein n=1 Tax=Methylorubrum extorquens TaxID=408 RepID=A0A2N9AVI8_METEX|nr:protein of unknown function [Methylorubrum extorquens]
MQDYLLSIFQACPNRSKSRIWDFTGAGRYVFEQFIQFNRRYPLSDLSCKKVEPQGMPTGHIERTL